MSEEATGNGRQATVGEHAAPADKQLRRCHICNREDYITRAEFRRHQKECRDIYWRKQQTDKDGVRRHVVARNHALRKPGKDYSKTKS